MVVLAIIVLLAASMPVVLNRALPARRVTAAKDQLITDLRWLQTHAAAHGRPASVSILPSGYRLEYGSDDQSKNIVLAESTKLNLRAARDSGHIKELIVYPDGTTSAGRFEISDSGRRAVVEISMLTGRAHRSH